MTKFFYDHGWHGINIEPLADKCAQLVEMRPRDINLCVGLGREHGKLTLFEEDMMSTFDTDNVERRDMHSRNKTVKPVFTLTEIYERYCEPNQEVHFCKIDVEGFEREVLEGVSDWRKFRPWIFAIESALPGTNVPCHDKWESILLDNDYALGFAFGINRYYIDLEKEYLALGFQQINQFVAQNEIYQMRGQRITLR